LALALHTPLLIYYTWIGNFREGEGEVNAGILRKERKSVPYSILLHSYAVVAERKKGGDRRN